MDWFVILGPALVLGALALLGFAGCTFEPGTYAAPGTLTFELRVPAAVTVVTAGFTWTDPAMVEDSEDNPISTSEGGFNLFRHAPPSAAAGSWTVTAGARVAEAGGPVDGEATTTVMFPGDTTSWRVDFEASGDPGAGTFRVDFVAFVQV